MKFFGGDFNKFGNWYEEACVVLQFLRILCDEAESLTWEPRGEENTGTDFILVESGKQIAVQCKMRSSGPWSPSDLVPMLEKVSRRLLGGGSFRFVTDTKPHALHAATTSARSAISDAEWLAEKKDRIAFVSLLGLDHAKPDQLSRARQVLARVDVRTVGKEELEERSRELAKRMSPLEPDALLARLKSLAEPPSLGKPWTAAELQHSLGPQLVRALGFRGTAGGVQWLSEQNRRFLGKITALGHEAYERKEVAQVIDAVRADDPPGLILVHGPAGSGKSHVLAQVNTGLAAQGIRCLGVRADAWREQGDDLIARFRAFVGDGRGCIIIDQLDQAAATPAQSHAGIKQIEEWIRSAVLSGLVVIIGCRSVDAVHETQIHQVLDGLTRTTVRIEVGELPESILVAQLGAMGVPLSELPSDLARLARNPMMLSLILDIIGRKGSWLGASSTHDLVDRWCELIAEQLGSECIDVIDELIVRMETDAVISVDTKMVPMGLRLAMRSLVQAGILIEEDGHVRLFHQLIADARSALRLGASASAAAAIDSLGPRDRQSFIEARRLRLAIPRFASRRLVGAQIVKSLGESPQIRSLLRRSILLGLADLRTPSDEIVQLVRGWLAGKQRERVLHTVVRGQTYWTDALDEWLDEAWTTMPELRANLLDCCASISSRRGDVVARHLKRWELETPGTIAQSQMIFWHNVSEDSDELFLQRLCFLATTNERDYFAKWDDLLASHPQRAFKLLRAKLERAENESLIGFHGVDWLHSWPADTDFIRQDMLMDAWTELRAWWNAFPDTELYKVHVAAHNLPNCSLWDLVQFLGRAIAVGLTSGELSWAQLMAQLPTSVRDIDGWLLLTVGAKMDVSSAPTRAAVDALDWFTSDDRWTSLVLGFGDQKPFELSHAFLKNLAPQLDRDAYGRIEAWLLAFRDEWTVDDERHRYQRGERGYLWPNDFGRTAFALLPALGSSRWSPEARSYYAYLEDKFKGFNILGHRPSTFGWVGAKVDDPIAQRWTAQQWATQLREAPEVDNRPRQMDGDRIGEHTKENVAILLGRCAAREPVRYVGIARHLADHPEGIPARTFSMLLDAIGRTKRPDQVKESEPWEAAPADQVVLFACHPRVITEPECARELARLVEARPGLPWPAGIVDRLIEIARGDGRAYEGGVKTKVRKLDLKSFRINEAPCMALHALASLAAEAPTLRPRLMEVARELVEHPDVARKASAAVLAAHCFSADPARCAELVLKASENDDIACEDDVNHTLRYCANASAIPSLLRTKAKDIMLGLTTHPDNEYLSEWGAVDILIMRAWGVVSHEQLQAAMRENLFLRKHGAQILSRWLKGPDAEPWMFDFALALAEDEDAEVGNAILWCLRGKGPSRLLSNEEFARRIISSRAAKRDQEHILDAFDEEGKLLPVSEYVLEAGALVAAGIGTRAPGWKRAHEISQISGLLYRLYEEASRSADWGVATRVLDLFDQLIDRDSFEAKELLRIMSRSEAS